LTETELIDSLQKGEETAFRELVLLYQDRVYNTVLGFLQAAADAEDLSQEVFIKVYQHIGSFKKNSRLGTWIYRIAVTVSLDALRKKRRQKRGGLLLSLFNAPHNAWEQPYFHHPGVAAEQRETSALLFKAVDQLPENQKTAFLLQKLEGLSQQEIADILKISVSAVESLLQRAKLGLRKRLTQEE
jgi:RNA polymerase sigma factor (sigma-70 family)